MPDRIEKELKQDIENEARMKRIFSSDILNSSSYLQTKLHRLEDIYARYKNTTKTDEQVTLQLLMIKKKSLEKLLYPGVVSRALRSFWSRFKAAKTVRSVIIADATTALRLQDAANKMGFSVDGKALHKQLTNCLDQFEINNSFYMNHTDRMDYSLKFEKDENGIFQFEQFSATLTDEKSGTSTKQMFDVAEDNITSMKAYNLLAGRTVLQEISDDKGNIQRSWIKLDFNDKDAAGNHKVKRFLEDYGFDLEKSLEALQLKKWNTSADKEQLITALKNGERKEVSIKVNGEDKTILLEVNAQARSFNFFDKNTQVSGKSTTTGAKTVTAVEIDKKRDTKVIHKRGLSI